MKKSTLTKIGIVVTGALLLGWLVLELTTSAPTKLDAAKTDPTICPECGTKLSGSGDCLQCIGEIGLEAYRAKKEAAKPNRGKVIPIALASLLCVLIAVHVGFIVRSRVGKNKDEMGVTGSPLLRKFKF